MNLRQDSQKYHKITDKIKAAKIYKLILLKVYPQLDLYKHQ